MIREVIRPQQTNFTITIPNSYLNQEIELIMFPISEREIIPTENRIARKSLRGVFNQYADSSKISLEDNAWRNHIMNKFSQND